MRLGMSLLARTYSIAMVILTLTTHRGEVTHYNCKDVYSRMLAMHRV